VVPEKPQRVVLYARVSRALPDTKSTADQLTELRDWANREQWTIVGEYADDGISASRYANGKHRPGWTTVTDLLNAGGADILAVWEISRASRDRDVFANLFGACVNARVMIATGGRLHDPADADDGFMLDLTGALAVREANVTSKRVRRAARSRAADGRPHGSLGYGYRRVCDVTTGRTLRWEADPATAPVVIEIIERLLRQEPAEQIARDLNTRGIDTPHGGRRWYCSTIAKLARRAVYAGLRVHEGKVLNGVRGTWPALITEDQHYAVHARYDDPVRDRWRTPVTIKHLGSGIYRCGRDGCDGRMRVVIETGKRNRYDCRECHKVSRQQDPVDALVAAVLVSRLSQPGVLDALTGDEDDPQIAAALADVARLTVKLQELTDAYDTDRIDLETFTDAAAKTRKRLEEARRRARPRRVSPVVAEMAGPWAPQHWAAATIADRRTVLDELVTVTILPDGRLFQPFNPESVVFQWR